MKFDIVRQPFVPAFLTLAALAVAAVGASDMPAAVAAPAADAPELWLPGEAVMRFQTAFPGWARAFACLLIIVAGIRTGHLTVRYNLYTVNTCLAIPLFGIIAGGLTAGNADFRTFLCSFLLILSIRHFCRSSSPNYAFDAIFRASLCLGTLILLCPKTLLLLSLLPLAIFRFNRTLRESVVAVAGLSLPTLVLCYVDWGAGHPFHAPLLAVGREFMQGSWFRLFAEMPLGTQISGCIFSICAIFALHTFFSNLYALGIKARRIFVYHIEMLLLIAASLCLPDSPTAMLALWAVPAAVLLPLFFVRIHPAMASPYYVILLAGTLFYLILQ